MIFISIFLILQQCGSSVQQENGNTCNATYCEGFYEKQNLTSRPNTNGPVTVHVDIHVIAFSAVNDDTMDYKMNIYLRLRWNDKRLIHGENGSVVQNEDDFYKIWTPDLYFEQQKDGHFYHMTKPNRLIRIAPSGDILFSQRMAITSACPMDLSSYPMDEQKCILTIGSYSYNIDEVILKWWGKNSVQFGKGSNELPEFNLHKKEVTTNSIIEVYSTGSYSFLNVIFPLRRRIGFYFIQVFIPSILIVALSWVNFWIDVEAVPARISLALLSVLTMTTQSSGIQHKLAKVSYIKAIDIWMTVCMAFVVAGLLEYCFVNVLNRIDRTRQNKEKNKEKNNTTPSSDLNKSAARDSKIVAIKIVANNPRSLAKLCDKTARVIFPTFFAIFNAIYWTTFH